MFADGELVASAIVDIHTWKDAKDAKIFEQSTKNIVDAISRAVKRVLKEGNVDQSQVQGIGFDATCSLAVTNEDGGPISVSRSRCGTPGERNIILWADHRAEKETSIINRSGSIVLDYVGGAMSVRFSL